MNKIHLLYTSQQQPDAGLEGVNINLLDAVVDASCIEIHAGNILEHIHPDNGQNIFDKICKKLRTGGIIRILGTDLLGVSTDIAYGSMEPSMARRVIHGKTLYFIQEIIELMESKGLIVVSKKFVDNTYIVEGSR